MLPLAGVAAVTLAVLAFADTALGYTTLIAQTPHLITLAGAVLLFVLVRTGRHGTGGPGPAGQQDPTRQAWPGTPEGHTQRARRSEQAGGSQLELMRWSLAMFQQARDRFRWLGRRAWDSDPR